MYNASAAFKQAVQSGAKQMALLIFEDTVFTNDDINISVGIEFNDYFNTEENISIGQALSNEISFSLFNDYGQLNHYAFGVFLATIGARISESTVQENGNVQATSGLGNAYVGTDSYPYLTRNGTAPESTPSAAVRSILCYGGLVYVYSTNGTVKVYNDSTAQEDSGAVSDLLKRKLASWDGKGICYADRILNVWTGARLETYEFVPLGYFKAERPNVPNRIELNFTCYDRMQDFEVNMPGDEALASAYTAKYPEDTSGYVYPLSFAKLFKAMCAYVDIEYASATFINSTATLSARPDDFANVTMREVLSWLAEAAGSVAKIDRDGRVRFAWFNSNVPPVMDESTYSAFDPYWYQTARVDSVCNRASNGSYDNYNGSGNSETILIQDNPLLKGVT